MTTEIVLKECNQFQKKKVQRKTYIACVIKSHIALRQIAGVDPGFSEGNLDNCPPQTDLSRGVWQQSPPGQEI